MNELSSDPLRCGFLLLAKRDLCAVFRQQGDGVLDVFVDVGCWTVVDDDAVVVFGVFDDVSQYVDQFLLSFLDRQQLVYVDGGSLGFSTLGGFRWLLGFFAMIYLGFDAYVPRQLYLPIGVNQAVSWRRREAS